MPALNPRWAGNNQLFSQLFAKVIPKPPNLQNAHLSYSALTQQSEQWQNRSLGAICFTSAAQTQFPSMPCLVSAMPILRGDEACEVWFSDAVLQDGQSETIVYRHDDNTLFGAIELDELTQVAASSLTPPLQQAAALAYQQIFKLLDELNFPHIHRFWNYMADINKVSHGLERYQQFNLGRQSAFVASGRQILGQLPAACALGTAQGPLKIAFIAGRIPAISVENPRQINAFDYPKQYGPSSPTFSRASLLSLDQGEILLISGTASVVGHESLHVGDVQAQTRESLSNLEAVVSEANQALGQPKFDLANAFYRIYIRPPADLSLVRKEMERVLGSDVHAIYLQAEVCRQDLLVEIEATLFSRTSVTAGCNPIHASADR